MMSIPQINYDRILEGYRNISVPKPNLDNILKWYTSLTQTRWNANTTGVVIALLSIAAVAWMRPWGIVGGVRNWGDWLIYQVGSSDILPPGFFTYSGSVILIGITLGSFVSACLANEFAIRIPPLLEAIKGIIGGCLMGIGAAFAGGCNIGALYAALGNLSAHGFAMWLGIVIGAIAGLKWLYWEVEHISWGSEGAAVINLPLGLKRLLGLLALTTLLFGAYRYQGSGDAYVAKLGVMLLISAAVGYAFQRGHWCMIQAFREPHMTGNATLAKAMALSIFIYAVGVAILKSNGLAFEEFFVRGTFGWGAVAGGLILGFGAMLAGGCGSGSFWRAGEGQIKLWLAIPFFGLSNSFMTRWFQRYDFEGLEAWRAEGVTDGGVLGYFIYMPDHLGYWGTVILIGILMFAWYVIVSWNEKTNKFVLET